MNGRKGPPFLLVIFTTTTRISNKITPRVMTSDRLWLDRMNGKDKNVLLKWVRGSVKKWLVDIFNMNKERRVIIR